ncbi:DUF6492 family protein [Polynucleobacter sphagniphilus]|jgi:hypothetical protein|uniref:Uncharacterized protein n=1 Tax=Polynucleobacter sphagniphilus TaxID=1743169 RepID=A0AA43M9N7_9BURK|nr:DUF6492 family protein [Polynucleobacter sphagniphilus]MDH6504736.1 hypothetical protein [Polynucleobacter sphagniphilus]MDH6513470.1 hypothetical protein [Polynucleobacter sphagniphilus]
MMIKLTKLDKLICVCCKRDAVTWKVASKYIAQNIDADKYQVYVPDHEVDFFSSISDKAFNVIGESIYTKSFAQTIKSRLPLAIKDQYGWYLQQFIKLSAAKDSEASEIVLIWDADTVPIRKLNFIAEDGRLIYYKGEEHHKPYFSFIKRLLGLDKQVDFSFIAQCFVMRASWLQEFCAEVERKSGLNWVDALLNTIDFAEGNGFSEYELLGTYFSHTHWDSMCFTEQKWLRLGNSTVGHVNFLNQKWIDGPLREYDYLSFEAWDRMKPYFWKVRLPYFLKVYLPSLFEGSKAAGL